ncbi:uncharacterized protein ymp isoform X1 [Drosophila virilis]|uniref:uncharacterized protein ymp isoform X1 n=1 Tax=Drosophila virilis TaxID=7244 RepID=UPI001396557F|nr:uncharacterized protein LOC26531379 isoform X1 [Drosophila virilis]
MAYRLVTGGSSMRGLLKSMPKINCNKRGSIRHSSVFAEPPVPWLEKPSVVFSSEALKHHWGALPLIFFSTIGFTIECLYLIRLAVTRDDVWFTKNPAACEYVETRQGYKVPVRKVFVFNQKYENPPGLLNALQGDVNGPPCDTCEKEEKKKGVSGKVLAAHGALGIGILSMLVAF